MAKVRRPALDYLVYLVVRGLVAVVQALPERWAYGFADLLAAVIHRVDRRHRQVAIENLSFAFPEKSPAEIADLAYGCYQHLTLLIIEIALLPRKMRVETWRKFATLIGGDQIVSNLIDSGPVLIVTAHFGNWELAGFTLGAQGFETYAIARVLDNPYLERYLKSFRERTGQTIIAKKDDFDRLTGVLQAGGKVATLGDQDAGPRGVFVPFFGRMASAHKAVALMAIEFQAKMMIIGVPRVGGPLQYEIRCEDVIDPAEYSHRSDAVKAITERYHAALERLIRQHPEQYFWLHRRWKTQPRQRG
ncbi:MAG: lysophospholipid acyltransferase family protein [Fimbriiglobus sp.]